MLVKKLLIILSLILTFTSLSFAEVDKSMINIEELSNYGLEYNLYENSQIIKIENDNNSIYMQVGNDTVLRDKEIKSFFINTAGVKLIGDKKVKRFAEIIDGNIYIPKELFYPFTYKENEYDVIVVGCDPEGVATAVSAARQGGKVLLLGEREALGGLLIYGGLATLDMNRAPDGELLNKGIFAEFYEMIGNTESFDLEVAQKAFTKLVEDESTLTHITGASNMKPILEENKIAGITYTKGDKEHQVYGKIVIDATQDGDICAEAGVPYYIGMEDINVENEYMAVTLVFRVNDVDWDLLSEDIARYREETGDEMVGINESSAWGFGKWCYGNYDALLPNMKLRGPNIARQNDGSVLINALQILEVNGLDDESVKKALEDGAIEAEHSFKYLQGILKSFENSTFGGVCEELYIRETRHLQGEYVVEATDLLEGKDFYDKVAMGSYSIDIQSTKMGNNGYVIGVPQAYSVPYRAFVPQKIDNLFIVGKAASYKSVGAGSTRVVPLGMNVGESIGIAAMRCILDEVTPRQIAQNEEMSRELVEELKENGVYLPELNYHFDLVDHPDYYKLKTFINLGILGGGYTNDFKLDEEVTVSEFVEVAIKYLQRSGSKAYTEENIEKIQMIDSDEPLTQEILKDLFEKSFRKGYTFIGEKNRIITREEMYITVYKLVQSI